MTKNRKKMIEIVEWTCPLCSAVWACNKAIDCPKCGYFQCMGTLRGKVMKELEDNNYYKLYVE